MKEALFYEKLDDEKVKCKLCWRECVIAKEKIGFCRVRKNIQGRLYSLNYGKIISMAVDPIEKKPFYHFAPGSSALSIACAGCNFACVFCCNYEISQEWLTYGIEKSPEEIVEIASRQAEGLSYTYTEPTVWIEYLLAIAKLAKKKGLYNTMVTNGYTQLEAVKELCKYLDAVVIDLKNSGNKKAYAELSSVPNPENIRNDSGIQETWRMDRNHESYHSQMGGKRRRNKKVLLLD
jgi:pyruvate formate lyase activating enzyme